MYAANHLKDNFPRGQFLGGYCQGTIIFGVIFRAQSSRAQLPKGNFTRRQLSSEAIAGGGNNPGEIFLGQFSSDVIVRGGGGEGGSIVWGQ